MRSLVDHLQRMTPETEQKTIELVRTSHAERFQQIKKAKAEKKPTPAIQCPRAVSKLGSLTEPAPAGIRTRESAAENKKPHLNTIEDIVANSGNYFSFTLTSGKTSNSQTPVVCDAEF